MLSALSGLLGMVFGWLGALFPASPFASAVQVTENMRLGLSWLNWVVPVGEMLAIMGLWIAAMFAVTAVKVALRMVGGVGGKVAGDA